MACTDVQGILYRGNAGQIVLNHANESFGKDVVQNEGFSKICRDPVGEFPWWLENQLFQIKAHPMVHTGGPGKFVYVTKMT